MHHFLDVIVAPRKHGAPQNGTMAVGSSATHIVVTTATQIVVREHVGTQEWKAERQTALQHRHSLKLDRQLWESEADAVCQNPM